MNPHILVLAFLLLAPVARGQVHELGTTPYDGPQSQADWGYKVAFDASGQVHVTGRSLNPSVGIPPAPPTEDTITLKYDANGTLLWSQRYDGFGGNDNGRDVAVDAADGSVYSLGFSQGYVGASYITNVRLIKYDAAGNQLWTQAWGGPANIAYGRTLRLDGTGQLFVAGYAYNLAGNPDGVVLRFDPAGNLAWATPVDGSANTQDYFSTHTLAPGGDVVAVGQANSSGSSSSILVARLSSSGGVLWQREYDGAGSGLEYALGVAIDAAGAAYVAGYTSSASNGQDATLLKYDAAGTLQWARTIDGAAHTTDFGWEVALDAQGNAYLAGYLNQGGATKIDFLLAKYDAAGNQLWQRIWDGPAHQDDQGQFVVVEPNGSVAIAGWSLGASGLSTDRDVSVVRYDRDGNLRWQRQLGSAGVDDDRAYDLAPGTPGTLALTGSWHGATQVAQDVFTTVLRDQARAFCFGDAQLGPCPCGNDSLPGAERGCVNSTGASAQLLDAGVASLASDSLVLTSSGELPSSLSIFLQGNAQVAPLPFGDGLRCAGGVLKRLYVKNATGGVVSAPTGAEPSVSTRCAVLGDPLSAGARRFLQTYYRDPSAGFCPAPQGSTFNVSSGLVLDWAP